MKYLPLLLTLVPFLAFSKTRLNDYYVGFEIATVDHDIIDGELFDLSANMPLEGSNLIFNLTFGDASGDVNGTKIGIKFDIGADYLHHFDNFDGFVPFVGVGLNYADFDVNDDIFWNLYAGLEFSVSDQLSLLPRLRLYQGFGDYDDTELEASISLTYWINDMHGLSLGYTHNAAGEADYIGLQYLYSWE